MQNGKGKLEKFDPVDREADAQFVEDLSLIDIMLLLSKRFKLIVSMSFIVAMLALGVSFLLPDAYEARVVISIPKPASVLQSLGYLSSLFGLSVLPSDMSSYYLAFLESRTLRERLLDEFGPSDWRKMVLPFGNLSREELFEKYVGKLKAKPEADKGRLLISLLHHDQMEVAKRANILVREMENLMNERSSEEAKRRIQYLEIEVKRAREALVEAESKLKSYREKTGVYVGDAQLMANVENRIKLRAEMAAKEVELKALLSFATPNHPEAIKLKRQIEALQEEIAKLERGASIADPVSPAEGMPAALLEYVELYRDLKLQESLYNALIQAYESAKLQQSFEPFVVQVIDWAEVPENKAWPPRILITMVSFFVGGLCGVVMALALEGLSRIYANPEAYSKLVEIKRNLGIETLVKILKKLFFRRKLEPKVL